jgi:DNA-binding transcriptional LysR family regulator
LQLVVAGYKMERQAGSAVPPSRIDRAGVAPLRYAQPIGLQTRHLEALVAVAAEGSFSGAARRLGYTPSAVSQQIAALERIVGQRLIDRSATDGARLTRSGALLYAHAESIIASIHAAEADLVAAREESAVRIGAVRTIAPRLFPPTLRHFRQRYPDKPLELLERSSSSELLEFVECGLVDAAFVSMPATNGARFDARPVLTAAFVLAVPSDSELAHGRRPVALSDVRSVPVIGFDVELVAGGTEDDEPWPWVTHLPQADSRTLIALVRAGLGAAIVPSFAIAGDAAIAGVPLADELPRLEIALVTNGRRSRLPLDWLEDIASDPDAGATTRTPPASGRLPAPPVRPGRATAADRLRAAWARMPRFRVPSLALAPACACVAAAAALVLVQPRPEAIAPAPSSQAPQQHAAARAAATEVASSGRWVAVSGRL